MTGFYGKTYRYKDKVIGACALGTTRLYMIGIYDSKTDRNRISLPLFASMD